MRDGEKSRRERKEVGKRRRKGLEHAEKEGTLSADGDDDDDDDDESALRERGREGKA